MLNKLNQLSVAAYVKTSAFFRGLKSDERGLSGVVVAVLLILVAVLAIVMLCENLIECQGGLGYKITCSGNTISGGSSFG